MVNGRFMNMHYKTAVLLVLTRCTQTGYVFYNEEVKVAWSVNTKLGQDRYYLVTNSLPLVNQLFLQNINWKKVHICEMTLFSFLNFKKAIRTLKFRRWWNISWFCLLSVSLQKKSFEKLGSVTYFGSN